MFCVFKACYNYDYVLYVIQPVIAMTMFCQQPVIVIAITICFVCLQPVIVIALIICFLCLQPVIAMTWDGWTDALAGLLRYEYEVYELGHDGSTLGENQGKMVKSPTTIELTATSVSY